MRLTSIGKLFAAALAIAAGVGAAALARDDIVRLFGASGLQSEAEASASKRMLVYRLDPARPLTFAFSRPAELVRIVAQPLIDPRDWKRRDHWTYGYRVILRDAAGGEIARHDIYSRALHPRRILPFRRPVRFMRDSELEIALQDDVIVSSEPGASTMEIVPLASDPGVRHIDLRVYERLPFIGRTAVSAFRRRSQEEQAELAEASALPVEMLTDADRAALMTNRWKVLGPTGIAGEDYAVFVVYEGRFLAESEAEGE